ncbi:MAG: hypothetical protein KC506_01390 [Nanoarchaeota archaeon]|nr:hypothetical protein [Nanoarchaeota archaeon]
MRNLLSLLVVSLLVISVIPGVLAVSVGGGITPDIVTEDFAPEVWMCGDRTVFDDGTEPGRITLDGQFLSERLNNYAFEGEQIQWDVLVFDKNGIDKVVDVYATLGSTQGEGNDIEVNCVLTDLLGAQETIDPECNARILEEELTTPGYDNVAAYYTCTLTVETPESMYGEYWVTVEALDLDGLMGTMDENEYWFFNPIIALSIDGDMTFEDVRPGTSSYSSTLLLGNDADTGSGVMLDMFISGTDFYDSSSSGARCPVSNTLELSNFAYFATSGAYSTLTDPRSDVEGYVPINYGIGFHDPVNFYDSHEVLQVGPAPGPYYGANILAPGAEQAITFRLDLPEPCNGDFDTGSLYFWGEAI